MTLSGSGDVRSDSVHIQKLVIFYETLLSIQAIGRFFLNRSDWGALGLELAMSFGQTRQGYNSIDVLWGLL